MGWSKFVLFELGAGLLGLGTKVYVVALTNPLYSLWNIIDALVVWVAGAYLFGKNARGAYDFILGAQRRFKRRILRKFKTGRKA